MWTGKMNTNVLSLGGWLGEWRERQCCERQRSERRPLLARRRQGERWRDVEGRRWRTVRRAAFQRSEVGLRGGERLGTRQPVLKIAVGDSCVHVVSVGSSSSNRRDLCSRLYKIECSSLIRSLSSALIGRPGGIRGDQGDQGVAQKPQNPYYSRCSRF